MNSGRYNELYELWSGAESDQCLPVEKIQALSDIELCDALKIGVDARGLYTLDSESFFHWSTFMQALLLEQKKRIVTA